MFFAQNDERAQQVIIWLIALFVFALLAYLLRQILTPFLIAAFFAYLGDPVVDRLELRGLRRTTAVLLVFALMTLCVAFVLLLLVPLLGSQIDLLRSLLPKWLDWFQSIALPWLHATLGIPEQSLSLDRLKDALNKNWQQASDMLSILTANITKSSLAVMAFLGNLALIPVVTFYLLRDWDRLMSHISDMLPRSQVATITRLAKECDGVLGAFLRGQLLIMFSLGLLYILGLWLLGLDVALLLGLIAGMASVVPYLGFVVGVLISSIAALVQFGDWLYVVGVLAIFGLGQLIESLFLTPVLVGDKIGLHPVAVIFAVLAGGQLFGFSGVLLALPIAAVLVVLLRHAHHGYKQSVFYGGYVQSSSDISTNESNSNVDETA